MTKAFEISFFSSFDAPASANFVTKMMIFNAFSRASCVIPKVVSFCSPSSIFSKTFQPSKNMPMVSLCWLNFCTDKTLVPRSAGISAPGKCRSIHSPDKTLERKMKALFRKWRVRQDPVSPAMMANAAELSV